MIERVNNNVKTRSGFTLLEVLLASAIGVMLLGGLYVAVDVQLRQMHSSSRASEQNAVAQGVLRKISQDLLGQLAPVLSAVTTNSATTTGTSSGSTTSGGTGATAGGTSATTPSSSGSSSGSSGSSSTAASGASSSTSTAGNVIVFNMGIQGDPTNLIINSSRVPGENLKPDILDTGNQIYGTSDLHRVMYWMAGGNAGLARYEMKSITSPDQTAYFTIPASVPDENSYIFAPEVQSIQFSYFDGTNWNDTWDGTVASTLPNSDTVTPQGPPIAVAIVIGVQTDNPDQQNSTPTGDLGGGNGLKMYRRVIAIPTANGMTITPAQPPTGQ